MAEDYKADTNQETRKSGRVAGQSDANRCGTFLSWLLGFQIDSL